MNIEPLALKNLDNPVWHSLSQIHSGFAVDYKTVKFYHPDYCPFGGLENITHTSKHIDDYSTRAGNFFIVGNKPELSPQLKLKTELVCLQMIVTHKIELEITETISKLTEEHTNSLFELVTLVQPGYFKKKTALLGDYFGIFKNDKLVAATGERMKMNDFTEVSAVVTHPAHAGKGYAKQLIAHTVNNNLTQNKIPFLHVAENNYGAIKLYEKLGFITRRKMSFWNIIKQ